MPNWQLIYPGNIIDLVDMDVSFKALPTPGHFILTDKDGAVGYVCGGPGVAILKDTKWQPHPKPKKKAS